MLKRIAAFLTDLTAALTGKSPRSSQWPKVRAAWLRDHPECAACGCRDPKLLIVHHILPFHVDPTRELDPTNLITLCESKSHNCHLIWGHILAWDSWNAEVVGDCAVYRKKLLSRPTAPVRRVA